SRTHAKGESAPRQEVFTPRATPRTTRARATFTGPGGHPGCCWGSSATRRPRSRRSSGAHDPRSRAGRLVLAEPAAGLRFGLAFASGHEGVDRLAGRRGGPFAVARGPARAGEREPGVAEEPRVHVELGLEGVRALELLERRLHLAAVEQDLAEPRERVGPRAGVGLGLGAAEQRERLVGAPLIAAGDAESNEHHGHVAVLVTERRLQDLERARLVPRGVVEPA